MGRHRHRHRHLTSELVVEILLHLPPKPLFRNKSVSKEWRLLISDPSFAAAYQSRNPPFFAGFICNHSPTGFIPHNAQVAVAPPHLPPLCSCFGSSNGLLLLLDLQISDHAAFSVLNPITGASVQIPEQPPFQIPDEILSGVYGFICNLVSSGVASYKVFDLSMLAPSPSNRLCIATFSSDTREWTTSYIDLPRHAEFCNYGSRAMVASNGIIYLIDDDLVPKGDESDYCEGGDRTVVSCDPTEGSAKIIALPPWDDDYCAFLMREYYDGSLSVCRKHMETRHIEVWVLSCDKTWTLKHTLNFGLHNKQDIQILYFCKEDRAIYVNLDARLVRCYYEDEQWRFEDICDCAEPCDPGIQVKAFTFSPWPISLPALTL